jgi:hypothetical protein
MQCTRRDMGLCRASCVRKRGCEVEVTHHFAAPATAEAEQTVGRCSDFVADGAMLLGGQVSLHPAVGQGRSGGRGVGLRYISVRHASVGWCRRVPLEKTVACTYLPQGGGFALRQRLMIAVVVTPSAAAWGRKSGQLDIMSCWRRLWFESGGVLLAAVWFESGGGFTAD